MPESLESRLAEHTELYVNRFNDYYYGNQSEQAVDSYEIQDPNRLMAYADRIVAIMGLDAANSEAYLSVYQSIQFGYRTSCELGWRPNPYDFDTYLLEMWDASLEDQRKKMYEDIDEYIVQRPQLDSFVTTYVLAIDPTGDRYNHVCSEVALLTLMMADRSLKYAHEDRIVSDFTKAIERFDSGELPPASDS